LGDEWAFFYVFLLGTVVDVITLVLIALVVAALYVSSPRLQAVVVGGLIGVVGYTSRRRYRFCPV